MPGGCYSRDDMRRFAIATAAFDRKRHARIWIPDETIIDAIRGNALCFANAHRIQVNLTNEDLAFGLASYRRARGQRRPKYLASAPLPLVSVLGAKRDKAA
jgi:hypothetical protein